MGAWQRTFLLAVMLIVGGMFNVNAQDASFAERTLFTGDWWGHRTDLANHGITFQGDVTQYYQGVTAGGLRRDFDYGGHADYVINLDMGKLAGREGLFVKVRGETQFGEFINRDVGSILVPNTEGLLPSIGQQETALTNFLFTQFLSEKAAVFAGKLDTLDGDMNAFAHGRGKNQFMNVAFVANPLAFRTVPYSTYGAGFVLLHEQQPLFTMMAIDPVDHATTGPDRLFSQGVTLAGELRVPTVFLGLPGHQSFSGTWSNRPVPDLDRLLLPPGTGVPTIPRSWSLFWNFDQYLVVDESNPQRGWGVFGRAGIADSQTNPLGWFLSFGLGGHSPLASRPRDTFGVGWFYSGISNSLTGTPLVDGQGVELFYNYAARPWLHITPDLQIVQPSVAGVDTALIVGMRVKVDL